MFNCCHWTFVASSTYRICWRGFLPAVINFFEPSYHLSVTSKTFKPYTRQIRYTLGKKSVTRNNWSKTQKKVIQTIHMIFVSEILSLHTVIIILQCHISSFRKDYFLSTSLHIWYLEKYYIHYIYLKRYIQRIHFTDMNKRTSICVLTSPPHPPWKLRYENGSQC